MLDTSTYYLLISSRNGYSPSQTLLTSLWWKLSTSSPLGNFHNMFNTVNHGQSRHTETHSSMDPHLFLLSDCDLSSSANVMYVLYVCYVCYCNTNKCFPVCRWPAAAPTLLRENKNARRQLCTNECNVLPWSSKAKGIWILYKRHVTKRIDSFQSWNKVKN